MHEPAAGRSARAALRAATSGVHERLHVAPPFLALQHGILSRPDYAGLLRRMAGYHLAVSRHVPLEPARLRRLSLDLEALGAPAPVPIALPLPASEAARLGWRYVVEGSIFGGRVIYRQLDYLFGAESRGRSFFRGAAGDGARWKALCAALDRGGATPGAMESMIAGALEAFAAFETAIAARESTHA